MGNLTVFTSLFITAFVAATVFLMQSEALLTALLLKTQYSWLLVMAISIGNIWVLVWNWWLDVRWSVLRIENGFPRKQALLERAQAHYNKWGRWSLLLSWVPFVGDPITVMAGVMKVRLLTFVLLVVGLQNGPLCRYHALSPAICQRRS